MRCFVAPVRPSRLRRKPQLKSGRLPQRYLAEFRNSLLRKNPSLNIQSQDPVTGNARKFQGSPPPRLLALVLRRKLRILLPTQQLRTQPASVLRRPHLYRNRLIPFPSRTHPPANCPPP